MAAFASLAGRESDAMIMAWTAKPAATMVRPLA
jgi:hypothetical protein